MNDINWNEQSPRACDKITYYNNSHSEFKTLQRILMLFKWKNIVIYKSVNNISK